MKNKLKRLSKIGIVAFGIILTITNCSKDEIPKEELSETQKIKNQFTLEDFDNPFVQKNLQINWNNFKLNTSETSPKSTYEFSTTLKANDFIENGDTKLFFKYTLEVPKIRDNQWEFEIIKFITEDQESLENVSSFSSNDFYGTITYFNLKGKLIETKAFEKGIKITPKSHNNILAKGGPIPTDHDPSDSGSGGAGFLWIEIVHYTDWYKVYPDGTQQYAHTVYNYSTWEYVYVPSSSNYSTSSPYTNHESNEYFAVNSSNNFVFNENEMIYDEGDKPLEEFNNKCTGINRVWQLSQASGDEYAAVLTTDGAILITQQLNSNGGGIIGIYNHNGNTYYQYPASQGSPSRTYAGQLNVSGRYFIPISATLHSHTPCINDGITNNTINDDQAFANHYPNVNHYIIACNAIGQFSGNSNTAFNIRHANLSTLCNNIN